MHKPWKPFTYRLRISLVMALFAIIPFVLFSFFYLEREQKKWEENALQEYSQMLAVEGGNLDRGFQEMELKILYARNDSSIRAALSRIHKMSLGEGLDFVGEMQEMANSIRADNENLNIRWYSDLSERSYGGYCYPLDEFVKGMEEDESLDRILNMDSTEVYSVIRDMPGSRDKNKKEPYACVYTRIRNFYGVDSLLELSMPVEKMMDVSGVKLPEGCIMGAWLLLEEEPQMLLISGDAKDAETQLKEYFETGDCDGYYPLVNEIDGLPGSRVVCLFQEDYVAAINRSEIRNYLMLMLLFVLTVFGCSYMASSMLTGHVERFIERVNDELADTLQEDADIAAGSRDLLGIEQRIRELIQNTQEYCIRLEQYEADKNRMELELLQMRFNPHFLYNTLASIRYQIKDPAIRKTIDSLIHYYRIVLSKGELFISIEAEMDMIREYLNLEIFSYHLENVRYEFDVATKVKDFTIIKHLLQPIVENALVHGVRASEKGGTIYICARLDGNDIVFEIRDDGVGMTREQMEHIFSKSCGENGNGGYGVYNVQQRIETYYGKGYGIQFISTPGKGTCATLRIPQQKGEKS